MKKFILYPLVFTLFPVLSLYQANADQITFHKTLFTLALVLVAAVLVWGLCYLFMRSPLRAAFLASVALFLFFSFGHFLNLLIYAAAFFHRYNSVRPFVESRAAQLGWFMAGFLLVVLLGFWLYKSNREPMILNRLLSFISVALIASFLMTGLAPIVTNMPSLKVKWTFDRERVSELPLLEVQTSAVSAAELPDIYYIILDGYGRQDVLKAIYSYDNSPFIHYLEQHGFYVAGRASTNYVQTHLSISSSMSMAYLDPVAEVLGERSTNITSLAGLIEAGPVIQQLRQAGYTIVNFPNKFPFTDIQTADLVYSMPTTPDYFQMALINNTPLSILLMGQQYGWHRQRILYTLDQLPVVTSNPAPTFVLAHILAPHPPFVFGPQGEPVFPTRKYSLSDGNDFTAVGSKDEYIHSYHDQISYLTQRLQSVIEEILDQSPKPPVIIMQADHGPGSGFHFGDVAQSDHYERGSILNAYLLPGGEQAHLYPEISPVNTFRIIFNQYLGTHYQLLEDRSYYSTHTFPLLFIDVTEDVEIEPGGGAP